MPTEQGRSMKKKEQEGKMRDKWPKCAWENREKSARRVHLDRTCGTQLVKHQLVINAPYTEYEASNKCVFISSNRRKFEQRGN